MFNYRGQLPSAMMRRNSADNCNFMDNLFRTLFSTLTHLRTSSTILLAGEQHWRNAL
ncbi:protein YdgV [Escherichia albertii]|uniref:protein YdgV n=1 Tax=Escherichia albertii TaxID=208962 RepID=UPI003FA53512